MKYCNGKYHGNIQKQIEDNEDYCILCRGREAAEIEEKKQKKKEFWMGVGKVAAAAIPAVLSVVINNKNDSSS